MLIRFTSEGIWQKQTFGRYKGVKIRDRNNSLKYLNLKDVA